MRRPFDERVDMRWFFASARHEGALLKLRCTVQERAVIAVLAGGLGYGKSMVAAVLAETLSRGAHPAVYFRVTPTTCREVLSGILQQLAHPGPVDCGSSVVAQRQADDLVAGFQRLLASYAAVGKRAVILLDAADCMPEAEFAGLVRVLRGLTIDSMCAPTTILVGSAGLLVRARRLTPTGNALFRHCLLGAMSPCDTAAYIGHRVRMARGDISLFTPAALELIHDLTGGVPRRINRLCDLSLLVGYAQECERIRESHVWTAQGEVRMLAASRTPTAVAMRRWRPLRRRELNSPR